MDIAGRPYLLQDESDEFFASDRKILPSSGGRRMVVDADVDLVVEGGMDVDIDAYVIILGMRHRQEDLRTDFEDALGEHELVCLVDVTLLEEFL